MATKKQPARSPGRKAAARPTRARRPSDEEVNRAVEEALAQQTGRLEQRGLSFTSELVARSRSVVFWVKHEAMSRVREGEEVDLSEVPESLSRFIERATWREVLAAEERWNNGEPFPPVPEGQMTTGPSQQGRDRLSEQRKGKPRGKSGDTP